MLNRIQFPALWIGCDGTIGCVVDAASLLTLTQGRLGFYQGLILVDRNGSYYRVIRARHSSGESSLWRRLITTGFKKQIALEFESDVKGVDIDVFKRLVLDMIDRHIYLWESAGNTDELKDEIANARSFDAIIQMFR